MPTEDAVLQWRGLTIRRELDRTHPNDAARRGVSWPSPSSRRSTTANHMPPATSSDAKPPSSVWQPLRSCDVIARFGGEEFVCSLAGKDASRERRTGAERGPFAEGGGQMTPLRPFHGAPRGIAARTRGWT